MKKYIKSNEYWPLDINTVQDVIDVIEENVLYGITEDDLEDYLIELEQNGTLDKKEFKELRDYGFGMIRRWKKDHER